MSVIPLLNRTLPLRPLSLCLLSLASPACWSQNVPHYVGGSLGYTQVSNLYRESANGNDDTVISTGLLAGADQRLGRQHVTVDASLQNNRYSRDTSLNNQSYSLRSALDWQTIGNLSGTLSATSSRALADFNIGGIAPFRKKNTQRDVTYAGVARIGVLTRYTVELGYSQTRRSFSAAEYERLAFDADTTSLGVYATPGANIRLGVTARQQNGHSPNYAQRFAIDPVTQQVVVVTVANDSSRRDLDLTASWSSGQPLTGSVRLSRSRTKNSLPGVADFSGTTGAISLNWQASAKLALQAQLSRDTGQSTQVRASDVNQRFWSSQLSASYSITSAVALTSSAGYLHSTTQTVDLVTAPGYDNTRSYALGVRWAYSQSLSVGCQYTRNNRDSSTGFLSYKAASTGCVAQVLVL